MNTHLLMLMGLSVSISSMANACSLFLTDICICSNVIALALDIQETFVPLSLSELFPHHTCIAIDVAGVSASSRCDSRQ